MTPLWTPRRTVSTGEQKPLMGRRAFIGGAAALAGGMMLKPPPGHAAGFLSPDRFLWVKARTMDGGQWRDGGAWYAIDGTYREDGLAQLNWAARDWRENIFPPADPPLYDALWVMQQKFFPDRPLSIYSGYRSPKTNAMLREIIPGVAKNSFHMYGKAIDFHVPGIPLDKLWGYLDVWNFGGLGYYPASDFIHIDIGLPGRRWRG